MRTHTQLFALARLGRAGMAPLTMSVPVIGFMTSTETISLTTFSLLCLVGLFAHLFGFAFNDLVDYPIDKESLYRQKSPLVARQISLWNAWLFVALQPVFVFIVYMLLLPGTAVGLLALSVSFSLSITYNLWSKTGRLPRFWAELSLALSIGSLCLAGAFLQTSSIPPVTILFALTLTLITLLVNSVASGLKDIQTDQESGAVSFVLAMGCRVVASDSLYISPRLRTYSLLIQASIMVGFSMITKLYSLASLVTIAVYLLAFLSTLHLSKVLFCRSFRQLRRTGPLLNGFFNYFALLLLLSPQFPASLHELSAILIAGIVSLRLLKGQHIIRQQIEMEW